MNGRYLGFLNRGTLCNGRASGEKRAGKAGMEMHKESDSCRIPWHTLARRLAHIFTVVGWTVACLGSQKCTRR